MNKLTLQRQIIKALILFSIIGGIAYKACSTDKIIKKEKEKAKVIKTNKA